MHKLLKQPRSHSHFWSSLGVLNNPKCKYSGLPKVYFPSSVLLLHPAPFLTSSSGISPPVFMILSLIPSFPHQSTCSPHYPFFRARGTPPKPTISVQHFHWLYERRSHGEPGDMGKIPENTLNINEITMYCSAQKQGKDVSLQDPQHTHTHKCLQLLAHLLKVTRNVLR